MENQYRDRLIDERFARDKERIENHEKHMDEQDAERRQIKELTIRMGELLDKHDEKIDNHEKRIEAIEQKPNKRWDVIIDKIITVIVAAFVAWLFPQLNS